MPVQSGTGDNCEAMACKECLHQGGQLLNCFKKLAISVWHGPGMIAAANSDALRLTLAWHSVQLG